jgi:hypothetical protein
MCARMQTRWDAVGLPSRVQPGSVSVSRAPALAASAPPAGLLMPPPPVQVPLACQLLYKSVQAPAYQVTKAGDCFWLGRLDGMEVRPPAPAARARGRAPAPDAPAGH